MVIDHADGLHVGVDGRGAHEFEAALFEVERPAEGFIGRNGDITHFSDVVADGFPSHPVPHVFGKSSEFFSYFKKAFCVIDGRFDFETITDDILVLHKLLHPCRGEASNFLWIKVFKGFSQSLSFIQNDTPRKSRLETFEDEKLKDLAVIPNRDAPLSVVVAEREGVASLGPLAAFWCECLPHGSYSKRFPILNPTEMPKRPPTIERRMEVMEKRLPPQRTGR